MKKSKTPLKSTCPTMTLREENIGKKSVNVSSMSKMQHLQNIATWASGDASIPCLAALYGRRLASTAAASGVALDRSLLFCQRCETILQPGDNCTVRIEKNKAKARRHKKTTPLPQNNVVYKCHFCSHCNVRKGSFRGHVKYLLDSRAQKIQDLAHTIGSEAVNLEGSSMIETEVDIHVDGKGNISTTSRAISEKNSDSTNKGLATNNKMLGSKSPKTPGGVASAKVGPRDGSAPSKQNVSAASVTSGTGGSRKRKRKGWSSLKDIVESNEHAKKHNLSNLVIPFKL